MNTELCRVHMSTLVNHSTKMVFWYLNPSIHRTHSVQVKFRRQTKSKFARNRCIDVRTKHPKPSSCRVKRKSLQSTYMHVTLLLLFCVCLQQTTNVPFCGAPTLLHFFDRNDIINHFYANVITFRSINSTQTSKHMHRVNELERVREWL